MAGVTSDEYAEIRRLRAEVKELRRAIEIARRRWLLCGVSSLPGIGRQGR